MSDPEVPQHKQESDVDDVVDSANAGLAEAEAARADVTGEPRSGAGDDAVVDDRIDPDLAAFEAAERDHPGTFAVSEPVASASDDEFRTTAASESNGYGTSPASDDTDTRKADFTSGTSADATIADTAYLSPSVNDAETRVVPSEPVVAETVVAAPVQQNQPIFVQAPEPPRERGNRGTAGAIGLLAALAFAILYLAIGLGWSALQGEVDGGEVVDVVLATLTTWAFWVPVAVFFIGFWLLGAIINRGRWGLWVIFGLLVGVVSYGGYILGQLFEAPFWLVTSSEATELVGEQLFAPLAIAAFVLGRELTIWFGAWVARSGARKTELNEEAQREYERTLEAGPTLPR